MILCLRPKCGGTRIVPSRPVYGYERPWWRFGRLRRVQVGDIGLCTSCGMALEVTEEGVREPAADILATNRVTIRRSDADEPRHRSEREEETPEERARRLRTPMEGIIEPPDTGGLS